MKKWLLVLGGAALAACATVPESKAPVAVVPAGPKTIEVSYEVPLPVKVTSHFADGVTAGSVTSAYDADGYLVKEQTLNANGIVLEEKTGKRSGTSNQITVTNGSGEVISSHQVSLSASGKILSEKFFDAKGKIQTINEYTYDKADHLILWVAKGSGDDVLAKTEYVYENGLNTLINSYDEKGQKVKIFQNTFDSATGYQTAKKEFEADGTSLTGETDYTFQDGKLVKEVVKNETGSIQRAIDYVLSAKGVPAKETFTDRRGKVVEIKDFEYTFVKKTKLVTQ